MRKLDGYTAVQLAYGERKEKNTPAAVNGHFAKAKTTPKKKVVEFRDFRVEFEGGVKLGQEITIGEVFKEGDFVDAIGTSKGKGFQGVVKRHNFGGVGQATHGQHNRLRAPGSIGACSFPARVFKGMRMAGRTGGDQSKSSEPAGVKNCSRKESYSGKRFYTWSEKFFGYFREIRKWKFL